MPALVAICLALFAGGCMLETPGGPVDLAGVDPTGGATAASGPVAVAPGPPPGPLAVAAGPIVPPGPATTTTVEEPADVKYYRSDEPLALGIEHFNRGHYGLAERYFRDAVEKGPRDVTAWVGLAACYDRIGRFDLADRAYRAAIRLAGETTQILNNQGYSYMLRGNLVAARRKFLKAYEREPNDPTVLNNLKLLNSSYKYVQRSADP
jgi:tetratricopeptide (TPR) repeat protein